MAELANYAQFCLTHIKNVMIIEVLDNRGPDNRGSTVLVIPYILLFVTVVALYDFNKVAEEDLTFTAGSIIYVVEKNEDGWCKGMCNGKAGFFPANYVSVLEQGNAPVHLPPSPQPPSKDPNAPVEYIEKGRRKFPHRFSAEICMIVSLQWISVAFEYPFPRSQEIYGLC